MLFTGDSISDQFRSRDTLGKKKKKKGIQQYLKPSIKYLPHTIIKLIQHLMSSSVVCGQ